MQSPGAPVIRPVTSAAKPAEPSWAVSTNSTPPIRIASINGSTLPLGMPNPRSIPFALSVATIRSALFTKRQSAGRSRRGGVAGSELCLGLVDHCLPDARDADIVLVKHFALARVPRHAHQHLAVLLQHVPVPLLEHGSIKKTPDFAGDSRGLAHPPEEHQAVPFIHRRGEADDAERSAGSGGGGVGD